MGKDRGRRISYAVLGVALALVAAPAIGATSPGTIKITAPVASSAHGGVLAIDWAYRPGSAIKSSSKVNVYWTPNGVTWGRIATSVPIRSGGVDWDTSGINVPVAIRVRVVGTTIRSTVSPVLIDNIAPTVEIVRPTKSQIIVDDQAPTFALVAGKATAVAQGRDSGSGIGEVRWLLDGVQIGTGASFEYNFGTAPGQHVLTAVAVDRAGNTAEDAIDIVATPGPSNAGDTPSAPEPPSDVPAPPSEDPTPPEVPSVPEVPSTDPTPTPDESDEPDPTVDPTELIPDAVPSP